MRASDWFILMGAILVPSKLFEILKIVDMHIYYSILFTRDGMHVPYAGGWLDGHVMCVLLQGKCQVASRSAVQIEEKRAGGFSDFQLITKKDLNGPSKSEDKVRGRLIMIVSARYDVGYVLDSTA